MRTCPLPSIVVGSVIDALACAGSSRRTVTRPTRHGMFARVTSTS
jgi:hypothetical protein